MPKVPSTDKYNFQSPSELFSSAASRSLALSLCMSLSELERTTRQITSRMDRHKKAIGESLPKSVSVIPTQIYEDGYAVFGVAVSHSDIFDYRGNPIGKLKKSVDMDMIFSTNGRDEHRWISRFCAVRFAQREAGDLNLQTNEREGGDLQWKLSKLFFEKSEPGNESATIASLKGMVDNSLKIQTKILKKMEERIYANQAEDAVTQQIKDRNIVTSSSNLTGLSEASDVLKKFRLGQAAKEFAASLAAKKPSP